jgi:hypothetical protein
MFGPAMTALDIPSSTHLPSSLLTRAAQAWFVTYTAGHWLFLAYIIYVFGGSAAAGQLEAWNERLHPGYVPGDHAGNLVVAAHLAFAAIVLGAGPLQLIPALRQRLPAFHRWTGRIYLSAVVIATVSGLYMLFARDIGSWSLQAGFLLQALLIVAFGSLALLHARARRIVAHRRWALRFFMVSSVALSYRVIFMIWFAATGGLGIDMTTGEGAFLDFMALGQFLPLLVLEAYFAVRARGGQLATLAVSGLLALSALATAMGVVMLSIGLWFA